MIRFFNGSTWSHQGPGLTANVLNGIFALDASHVWAVGDAGTILAFNGSAWAPESSGTEPGEGYIEGISAADLSAYFEHFWLRNHFLIQTPSLEYLRRGGRIRWSQQVVGGMLGIRPLVHVNDAMVEAYGKPRGERRAFGLGPRMAEVVGEAVRGEQALDPLDSLAHLRQNVNPGERVYVGLLHANWPESVPVLRDTVLSVCPDAEFIMEGSVGSVIGVHIGPQASALMFVPE